MLKIIALALLAVACSSGKPIAENSTGEKDLIPVIIAGPKEFNRGELILANQLLTKIFDQEMPPVECVQDSEEASLLLRTILPRMEVVEDDLEAMLDAPAEIQNLITSCEQNCTCAYIDDLFKEHQVMLTKKQKSALQKKRTEKELNRCLSFIQTTFCRSELYQTLDKEKSDFSFEEGI